MIESLVGTLANVVGRFRRLAILPRTGSALLLLTKSIGRSGRPGTLVAVIKFFAGRVIHNTTYPCSVKFLSVVAHPATEVGDSQPMALQYVFDSDLSGQEQFLQFNWMIPMETKIVPYTV